MRIHPALLLAIAALLLGCSGAPEPATHAPRAHVASAAAALAVGTVQSNGSVSCPSGPNYSLPQGTICHSVAVSCPSMPALGATLLVSNPAGVAGVRSPAPAGTIVYLTGGPGVTVSPDEQAIVPTLTAAGYKVLQVVWQSVGSPPGGWQDVPAHSVLAGACRPATLLAWLRVQTHDSATLPATRGFCAQGYSAGSAAIAYSLAYYGGSNVLDYAQLLSGPPLADMAAGCSVPAASADACGVTYSLAYEPFAISYVDRWEGLTTCQAGAGPSPAELAHLAADSVLTGPGAVLGYPYTPIGLATCDKLSAAAGMSVAYEKLTAGAGTAVHRLCVSGNCSFENVLADPQGRADVAQDMADNCHASR